MEYSIVRSNRKTLCLTFDREGKPLVRAPLSTSLASIERFVQKHARWIAIHSRGKTPPSLADGSKIEFLGEERTIASGATRLKSETLFLPPEQRAEALKRLCRSKARVRMQRLVRKYSSLYGFSTTGIRITSARKRWGSCSTKGTVNFSLYSAFLPESLAEYLAVHELCHTRHMDHSAAFWVEVKAILPDYAKRRDALKKYMWIFQI